MATEESVEKYVELYNFWQNLPENAPPTQDIIEQKIQEFLLVEK